MAHDLLKPPEVADMLRVSEATVRRWLNEDRLSGIRLPGGDWRIRRTDVLALIDGKPAA